MAGASEYVLEPIREGAEFTLFRGGHHGNPMPLLVVTPSREQPLPQTLQRLKHEFSLATELDPAWAAKPIDLTRHEGRTILVLADPGGEPLDRVLGADKAPPLHLPHLLRVAINLSTALGHAHQRGLIHKDLKPENVLVDDGGHVWLTGFGIASQLLRERQSPAPPEIIAGTLAYMSPEQTGRMNRSMDTRSDLYSLGIVLYQMFTGALPFAAADPLEWVHCHIARQPIAPANRRDLPEMLSAVIMRLLAKNAEERYQTAAGLEADLRRCLSEWQSHGRVAPFALGTNDSSDRLLIPEKLYGREREVQTLLTSFDRVVAGGRPELVLVSGYSGIGKSAVVNELHKSLVPPKGLFASGKFDQYKRDIPYTTVAQAFQSLLRPILSKPEAELSEWRDALKQALSPNGSVLMDIVPELRVIIGEQPSAPPLPPQEAKARLHLTFRQFIGVFARPEHPLALFLDDLQWLDAATLELLEDLLTRAELRHLLLIGAYRDNEVSPAHLLIRKLQSIRQAGATVREIALTNLSSEDLGQLLSDSLHCESTHAAPLAQLIYLKTTGNPFFAIQFISALADEGLLKFEYDHGRWSWDLSQIYAKGYTDNVVDLMVAKLSRLPLTTQQALQKLACLGNSAELALLRMVFDDSVEQTHNELWEAVRTGLVFRTDNSYRFLHDRVQEAAYSLIPQEQRAEMHLRIGTLLAEHIRAEKLEESIFEVVNQLNRGLPLLTSSAEREQAAALNLIAGRRAKASTAYTSALTYLNIANALLTDAAWEQNYTLIVSLECLTAECELLTAEMGSAETRLATLAQKVRTAHDIAVVARLMITLYTTLDRSDLCVDVFLEYLRRGGTVWARHPNRDDVLHEYDRLRTLLGNRQIEELLDLPLMTDPDILDALDVFTEIIHPALFFDENLSSLVICRMVSLSLDHGNCDASCFGYEWFAMIAGPRFNNYKDGYRFGQLGLELVETRGLMRYQARTYLTFATLTPWTKHFTSARELIRRGFDAAHRNGDLTYSAYSGKILVTNYLMAGDPLAEVQAEAEKAVAFAAKSRFGLMVIICGTQRGLIRTLRGLTAKFGCFEDEAFDELTTERQLAANPAMSLAEFFYWTRKLQGRFFAGDYAAAVAASERAQSLLWTATSQVTSAELPFYGALARAACCDLVGPDQSGEHLEALKTHLEQLAIWRDHCPENFENRAALVGAEFARIEGREMDAERLYEKAIRSARANGFIQNQALAHELASRFYAARGLETASDAYLRNARDCYDRWGAHGKVKQLDEQYPLLRAGRAPASAATIGGQTGQLDLETVVKASQTISSEMLLPTLIEKLLRIAVENAGAERGLLILLRGGEPQIQAEANAGPTRIEVAVRETPVAPSDLPESALRYVIRTQQGILLDNASADSVYSTDEYVVQTRCKSILCLPIVKQAKLVGALYLENNLTACAFTPDRVTVLQLLASQAAISLENSGLYSDLQLQAELLQRLPVSAWTLTADGTPDFVNEVWLEYSGQSLEFVRSRPDAWMSAVHPDDREAASKAFWGGIRSGEGFAVETRSLRAKDGTYRWHLQQAVVLRDAEGKVLKFVGTTTDIDEQKRNEEKIRQSDKEARQLLDLSPLHITELGPDGARLYTNRASLDYYGMTLQEWLDSDLGEALHPQDTEFVTKEHSAKLRSGSPFEYEVRLKRKDGQYRWFHRRLSPMSDEQGRITRWYAAGTDIDDRKRAEQRLQEENVALREEIDKASMFEEIVGTSAPLKNVLSRISKVAQTDSSVLITGETGTGKELVARAIHRRSRRSSHPFVSVNCAVIPRDLIASELFGHEKGAFTGATQRRLGRFELAEKGTIFLDEVGELPAETQIALLRVLQEREFERVGGSGSIQTDVRVVAATNRDLEAAIAAGVFRSDLYYRLNVFPIEMPTLRERKDDIPLLVTYFLNRYARKAGKHFKAADKKSLELLQTYAWPGNIRELQNVIERSIIVSESETFSIDESWLSSRPPAPDPSVQPNFFNRSPAQEKALIEAALTECGGRVYGPSGAAAKLGIPRTTLETKIKSLKINKHRFKGTGL